MSSSPRLNLGERDLPSVAVRRPIGFGAMSHSAMEAPISGGYGLGVAIRGLPRGSLPPQSLLRTVRSRARLRLPRAFPRPESRQRLRPPRASLRRSLARRRAAGERAFMQPNRNRRPPCPAPRLHPPPIRHVSRAVSCPHLPSRAVLGVEGVAAALRIRAGSPAWPCWPRPR